MNKKTISIIAGIILLAVIIGGIWLCLDKSERFARRCGNGICEEGETVDNCPRDCEFGFGLGYIHPELAKYYCY